MAKSKRTDGMNTNGSNDSGQLPSVVPANVPADDVFTSYIFSTSSRSLSKYGERLLMEVISVAQEYTVDAALGMHRLDFAQKYSEKFAIIDIPVRNLLNADDTTNYTKAKEAAVELMKIYHTVESPVLDENGVPKTYKDGSPQYQFASYHLLDQVTVNHKPGIVSVKLGEQTWSQILDMGKGYTRYNLLTAKSLDNVVAIRLFQLLSNSSVPLSFSIDRIKGIFGLQDKYVNNATGFIRRVIVPAEIEIAEKCPFEVVHEPIYSQPSGKGRPLIVGLTFSKILKHTVITNPSTVLDPALISMLMKNFGFDERGLRSNAKLFHSVLEAGHDLEQFLEGIRDYALQANSPQGYVIRSLQNLLSGVSQKKVVPVDAIAAKVDKPSAVRRKAVPLTPVAGSRLNVNSADAFSDSGIEEL